MNILLTGGAGFIGSHLAEAYLREGHRVVVLDDLSTGRASNVPPGAVLERLDVRDSGLKDVFERHEIEFVNHHAARADVRDSVKNPGLYLDVNVAGGLNLLECVRRRAVRGIVFASSGGCSYGEPDTVPTDESHPVRPHDPYGASKVCFELYLQTYRLLYGIPYTIFRYPNVYGPRQNPSGEAGVVAIFIMRMLEGLPVTIYGDGSQVRDFVFVDDIVDANLTATSRCAGQTFNLGWGRGYTVNEIFAELGDLLGCRAKPVFAPPRLGEISRSVLAADRVRAEWGWTPRVGLREGLRRTADHIKDYELGATSRRPETVRDENATVGPQ